jgi:protein TonB
MKNILIIFSLFLMHSCPIFAQNATSNNDAKNASNTPFSMVEQMPEFPGGEAAMFDFIRNQFMVPDSAKKSGLDRARIIVRFVVAETGLVKDVITLNKVGFGLDEEAIRLVRSFPKWKPGKQNGKPVPVYFTLPLNIEIDNSSSKQKN